MTEEAIAKEYGYKIRGFHHALEMYKVGDKIAPTGTGIATFADWWGFKDEAWDAIPWNAVMSMREGVRVALKERLQRLRAQAEPGGRQNGALWRGHEEEALRMITLNAAWIIGVDDRVGSIDNGKDGDVVIWNIDPLSTYARVEKVLIDGDLFFDSSLPGFGTTHFSGVMHDAGGDGGEDEEETDNETRTSCHWSRRFSVVTGIRGRTGGSKRGFARSLKHHCHCWRKAAHHNARRH